MYDTDRTWNELGSHTGVAGTLAWIDGYSASTQTPKRVEIAVSEHQDGLAFGIEPHEPGGVIVWPKGLRINYKGERAWFAFAPTGKKPKYPRRGKEWDSINQALGIRLLTGGGRILDGPWAGLFTGSSSFYWRDVRTEGRLYFDGWPSTAVYLPKGSGRMLSNNNGELNLTLQPGRYTAHCRHPSYGRATKQFEVDGTKELRIDLVMKRD